MLTVGDKRIGFEARFSSAPKPARGFWHSSEDIGLQHGYLVAPVRQGYLIAASASVISLADVAGAVAAIL